MGRKPNKQNEVTTVEQTAITNEEQNEVTTVELIGLQTIIGTGKGSFLKNGVERIVSPEMAVHLINKGVATLK